MGVSLEIKDVSYGYKNKDLILKNVNLIINKGEMLCLIGKSGCGKTTLLNIAAGLLKPQEGCIIINDKDISKIKRSKMAEFRGENIGYVFQSFNLINNMTVLDNVAMPLELSGCKRRTREELAFNLLEDLELHGKQGSYPYELSGGEQQRAAIGRALIRNPKIILADEPTGNLDSETGSIILRLLKKVKEKYNTSILIATHDLEAAGTGDRVISIKDGRL